MSTLSLPSEILPDFPANSWLFRSKDFRLDDPSGNIVLPGASRAALEKLPVFVGKR